MFAVKKEWESVEKLIIIIRIGISIGLADLKGVG